MKPEYEIYELTCNVLREKLRNDIRGCIKVWVDEFGSLQIYINNDGFEFNYTINRYLEYVLDNGTETVVNDVESVFRRAIMGKYFK